MSEEDSASSRYREFLHLLPLTIAIAGLPTPDGNRNYTHDQLQARAQIIGNAYRLARQVARECITNA
ncbi:MAG: hypothetical protein K1X71_08035 [Pirellulales bacterium]|nr:hypothetical protein [Pirellulales bacterium]